MTPHECAKLQCLDELNKLLKVNPSLRALGNAVNSKVVEWVANALLSTSLDESYNNHLNF